jgi:polyphosphate kinase
MRAFSADRKQALMDASNYINRELSWLEFNRRVLEEAKNESVPLLERVKFLAIFSSNLDEFFMVRVARLKRLILQETLNVEPDGLTHAETLIAVSKRVHELAQEQHLCFLNTMMPQLSAEGIHLVRPEEMSGEQERFLEEYFHRTLYPIVTPLAIDPGHPFPYLANRSLCLVVSLRTRIASRLPHTDLSIVHIPTQVAPRFIALRAVKASTPSCCWKTCCIIIYRGSIMALRFSLATRSGLRVTPISARCGATRTFWRPSSKGSANGAWVTPSGFNMIPSCPKKLSLS